jgi:hypothetical protein
MPYDVPIWTQPGNVKPTGYTTPVSSYMTDKPSSGGGQVSGGGAPPWNAGAQTDYIQQYLNAVGAPPQANAGQIYKFITAQDPNALKSQNALQKYLQSYSDKAQWAVPGSTQTGQTAASIIDPLAVQQFFQGTIAPYLNQVATNEQTTANQLRNQPMVQGLPASYAAVVKQGEQNQATDMDMLMQATQAAGAVAPQVSMLNQMLGLAQKASLTDYYRILAGGQSGATQAAPLPTSQG